MRSKSTRVRIAILATSALSLAMLAPSSPAHADNYSNTTGRTGCTGLNEADNKNHYFHYADLQDHNKNATDWARWNNLDPTDINTYYDSTLDAYTDVVVRDQRYSDYCGYNWMQPGGTGTIGLVTCNRVNTAMECEQHTVRYNINFTAGATTTQRRSLACHELGHSIGLEHRSGSCMSATMTSSPSTSYSTHDRSHINSNY